MRMKTETMKMANGGTVDKVKKKVKDTLKKLKPRPTGPDPREDLRIFSRKRIKIKSRIRLKKN